MGLFQRVGEWLTDKSDRFVRGGATPPANSYYGSDAAEQAYAGARAGQDETDDGAERLDPFGRSVDDEYGGRVPYRSQKDLQAEQMQETVRRQAMQKAQQMQRAPQQQPATYPQAFPAAQPQIAPQPAQAQPSNVMPFPGMTAAPDGNVYAHTEYVVLLRSRNECTRVIEYIKSNASVFLNMEFIANDSERQRCVDMLSGAAYTLGCKLNKISQRGVYLISSPSVNVIIDQAMQKVASAPEAQGYVGGYQSGYGDFRAQQGFTTRRTQAYAQGGYPERAPAYGGYAQAAEPAYPTGNYAAVPSERPTPPFGGVMSGTANYPPVTAETGRYAAEYQ